MNLNVTLNLSRDSFHVLVDYSEGVEKNLDFNLVFPTCRDSGRMWKVRDVFSLLII